MSISIRKTAAAVLAAGVMTAPMLTAASASASVPDRTVVVYLSNLTGCTMTRAAASLSHGIWVITPAVQIANNTTSEWESDSKGLLTGTEGTATYVLGNCADPAQNAKLAIFHWDNPYVGSNTYDTIGTTPGITIVRKGGSGDNAIVNWLVRTS